MDDGSFTFDDDGNPIPAEKPPAVPKSSRSKSRTSVTSRTEFSASVSSGIGTVSDPTGYRSDMLSDMFHIDGKGFDVTVSISLEQIRWNPIEPKKKRNSHSFSGFFRRSSLRNNFESSISLSKVYGARIKRRQKGKQAENEGYVLGLGIFTYINKDANILRVKEVYFEHPSVEICTKWGQKLTDFINSIPGRPKNVKLFLQPYAGDMSGRDIYKYKVLPMFQNAGVAVDFIEVKNNEHIKQDMIHTNLEDFDCIIAMGGDGTVNQVLNGLMNRTQKEKDVDVRIPGFMPVKALVPLGIIPIGRTNHIAHTAMGTADVVTAVLHIIYGHWTPVDICSLNTPERFYRWAFNCHYGFSGNVLKFMKRYSVLGDKSVNAAFIKALTSSKLRAYGCEIEYIPTPKVFSPTFNQVCRTGCQQCVWADGKEGTIISTDEVQELDPLNNSASSQNSVGSVIELKQDNPWTTLKGEFMNVSILAIPGNCEIAPQGISKFTHLSDGNVDLVVVKQVERKDFLRFLRRHGNSKNQFDFPFVEVIRCKQVRFRPRIPTSWNYDDHDFSEINYQMSQLELQKRKERNSMEVIDILDASGELSNAKSSNIQTFIDSDDDMETIGEHSGKGDNFDSRETGKDGLNPEESGESSLVSARDEMQAPKFHYVGPQYRATFREQEIVRRKKMARKKEEKMKAKEESKLKSVWNVDNEICDELELNFRVHCGLLMVCGQGISPHSEFSDVRFGCLPA